jgi:hypothetical protein
MAGQVQATTTSRQNFTKNIPDYSEGMIRIRQLRLEAHDALLKKDWKKAADLADEIVLAARSVKLYCLNEIDVHQNA